MRSLSVPITHVFLQSPIFVHPGLWLAMPTFSTTFPSAAGSRKLERAPPQKRCLLGFRAFLRAATAALLIQASKHKRAAPRSAAAGQFPLSLREQMADSRKKHP
ncbi:UNVERIFIED_CONTAM: hypothetical protein K2H54_022928 [Gekko kuhli]